MNNHDHFIKYLINLDSLGLTINNYPIITIFWNLFLLVVPFFLCRKIYSLWLANKFKNTKEIILAFILFFIWLLFIPNTAYIITDVRHIAGACPLNENRICIENAWMVLFFFSYSIAGWLSYVFLLNQMKAVIENIWGKSGKIIFLVSLPPLTALGVLLGLVNRWNSWDIFLYPGEVITGTLAYFTDWTYLKNLLLYSFFLYFLYFIGNYFFKNLHDGLFKDRESD